MMRNRCLATLLVVFASTSLAAAKDRRMPVLDGNGNLDALIAKHASANNVPEELVRRVIKRESGGNPHVVSKGNYGLMQIKLGTARALGYQGGTAGLLDADTNMTYAVKYLAGAYQVAGGNSGRAVHYYAAGYYYAAKRQGRSSRVEGIAVDRFKLEVKGEGAIALKTTPAKAAARLREARANGHNVASSSSLYTGQLDYY